MIDKVKLVNPTKFDVGVRLIDPQRELNIKAGSFVMVTKDDVYYLDTISKLLKKGHLIVNDEEINMNLGFTEQNMSIFSDQEIETLLLGNYLKMEKELSKYTEPHVTDAIYQIAKRNIDKLSGGKIKFLQKFCKREFPMNIED